MPGPASIALHSRRVSRPGRLKDGVRECLASRGESGQREMDIIGAGRKNTEDYSVGSDVIGQISMSLGQSWSRAISDRLFIVAGYPVDS